MKLYHWKLLLFLSAELFFYVMILGAADSWLAGYCFSSIVLCYLFVLLHSKRSSRLMAAGLGCTVLADLCLVVFDPVQRLHGMVFFLCAQILYAIYLHKKNRGKCLIILRLLVTAAAVCLTGMVLKDQTDALAVISLCYYANLIMNIVTAFCNFRDDPVLPVSLVLFLLCDTVIGLQVASGNYLNIGENSFLYRLIFTGFNLAWFFYLPSQVLIALRCAGYMMLGKGKTE